MKNRKILLLALALITSLLDIRASALNPIDSLSMKISKMEKSIDSISLKLNEQIKTAEYAEQTYQTAKNVFTWKDNLFFGGIALVSLLIAIITLFGIKDWIRNFVDRKVIELTENNTKELKRLVENERWGIELKQKVKIYILNRESTKVKQEIIKIVETFDYSRIDLKELSGTAFTTYLKENEIEIKKSSFTIIVIDDDLNEFKTSDSNSFMEEISKLKIGLLLYGNSKLDYDYELKGFAKNPYSLYSNLNQLMKYMDFREN